MHHAAFCENRTDPASASVIYLEIQRRNPALRLPYLRLATMFAGPLKDPEKALSYAKKAHELAPEDPHASALLGRSLYQGGSFSAAYVLLQECGRHLVNDPAVQYDLGWAAYAQGLVAPAREAMTRSVDAGPDSSLAAEARQFLAWTEPAEISAARLPELRLLLETHPDYPPALMAQALLDEEAQPMNAAVTYASILQRFPDFAPAQARLGRLYLDDPAQRSKAYELVMKARKTLPADARNTQTLARLSCERSEFAYAVQLLQESSRERPLDPASLFTMGLSQRGLKAWRPAEASLQKALRDGLAGKDAERAKEVLVELSSL
jgi:predicted Zn-dependent protease